MADNQEEFQIEDFSPGDTHQQDALPGRLARALRKLGPGKCIVHDFRHFGDKEQNRVRALRHALKATHGLRVSFYRQPEPDRRHKIVLQEDLRAKEEGNREPSLEVTWGALVVYCRASCKDKECNHVATETNICAIDECPLRVK